MDCTSTTRSTSGGSTCDRAAKHELTKLGFGAAPIGNLYVEVSDDDALMAVQRAFEVGIRYFDTAPYYGYGLSEERLGRGLSGIARDAYVLSTKVGRCVRTSAGAKAGGDGFAVSGRHAVFDYSRGGIMRSIESSLKRLNTDYIDILLLHDVGSLTHGDQHPQIMRKVLKEALPAMAELKTSGVCGAIGIGVNEEDVCLELMPLFPLDYIMLAGRYTLLEQAHSRRVLAEAQRRGVAMLSAGPYNSGLLGGSDKPGKTYNYAAADPEVVARAQKIYDVCAAEGVDVGAVALQFPLAHPTVATVVTGMRNIAQVESAERRLATPVPPALWERLRSGGLIIPEAPVPA